MHYSSTSASILILLSSVLCVLRTERSSSLRVFLSPDIYYHATSFLLSLPQSFFVQSSLLLPSPSFSIFIRHHTVLTTLFLSHSHTHTYAKCTSFRVYHPSSLTLYLNPTLSSLFFSSFEGNDYSTSRLCFSLLSFPIFIIYLHHPYYFKFRLSRCYPRPLLFFTILLLFSLT